MPPAATDHSCNSNMRPFQSAGVCARRAAKYAAISALRARANGHACGATENATRSSVRIEISLTGARERQRLNNPVFALA